MHTPKLYEEVRKKWLNHTYITRCYSQRKCSVMLVETEISYWGRTQENGKERGEPFHSSSDFPH